MSFIIRASFALLKFPRNLTSLTPRRFACVVESRAVGPASAGRGVHEHALEAAKAKQPDAGDKSPPEPSGCLPVLVRITWLMWGNLALLLSAALVAEGETPILSDVLFFAVCAGLIGVRYLDIVRFNGETSDGERATLADWRRYSIRIGILSAALWTLARLTAAGHWI